MITIGRLMKVLQNWTTLLGTRPSVGAEDTGRALWPVTAEDGRRYYLKRLGPWRNLPVADEARVLRWLTERGVGVPEFMITDHATLFGGEVEDSFVLFPHLDSDQFDPAGVVEVEQAVGRSVAELHRALAAYPWPANSYVEDLSGALQGELLLPDDVAEALGSRRDQMAAALARAPRQLVHGDLTPDNVLLRRPAQVAGFIDFDHLPLAPRVWDIAKYLSRRMRLRRRRNDGTARERVACVAGFVRGYHRQSPLCDAEIDALPAGIAAGNIIEASYGQKISSGLLDRRKLPDHDEVLADALEAARWHLANADAVEHAVRASVS